MKVSDNDNTQFLVKPIDPLMARLLCRYTHALGTIDTRHTQKRHNKLVGWLESRFLVATQLMQRCRSDDGQPLQPGQMVYPNSFWHSGQIAAQTNPFSNHSEPNIPYGKETSLTNFDSTQPAVSGLRNVSETHVDRHALPGQDDSDHSQQEPVAAVWRLRRAASTLSLAPPEVPETPTPKNATTAERKASNDQTVNNVASNKGNNNPIQRTDLSLMQSNNRFTHSAKPSTIAKAKLLPKTLAKVNRDESLLYPLTQSNAVQNLKSSTDSRNHLPKHSKIARTWELTSPEISKPDLFVPQSPKSSTRVDGNRLKPMLPQTNAGAISYLQGESHRENSALANKPVVIEEITPNSQTVSPRFSKKEWAQLIESVSKVIGDKLLADLDRRGIRIWR
jgi:hypothetical protein